MSKKEREILNGNSDSDFERFLESTSKLKVPSSNLGKEAVWDKLMQSIEQESTKKTKVASISPLIVRLSVAATLTAIFTIATLSYKYSTLEFVSQKGSTANIVLPDSSAIILNADSRIEYRRFGWLSDREIKLNGEAYFSVKHGNRFSVLTEFNRNIIVTGTKFNVFARGAQFEVKCFEGSVRVETPKTKSITLSKGKGINLSVKCESPQPIEVDSTSTTPKWIAGDYYFNNSPLSEVLDELSRQFNVSINFQGFKPEARNYTGFFKRKNLTQALDLVCIPMGLTYQISSDSTSIKIKK
ncbi:MAG: FecR family protein [Bacteroidales bacterium]|nr:FecR family protein [Bacteroidales bacterium]